MLDVVQLASDLLQARLEHVRYKQSVRRLVPAFGPFDGPGEHARQILWPFQALLQAPILASNKRGGKGNPHHAGSKRVVVGVAVDLEVGDQPHLELGPIVEPLLELELARNAIAAR
jgi:hypothetical protein